jgi:hypothetical protein
MRFSLLLLLPLAAPLWAQDDNTGLLPYMPEAVQEIRKQQVIAAEAADIVVSFNDAGMRSATGLRGIPRQFRDLMIKNEQDLLERIEELYPLFGFRRTETLRFVRKTEIAPGFRNTGYIQYYFAEYISDIPTNQFIVVEVDEVTGIIFGIDGSLLLDRGFPRASIVSQSDAIACGLAYIRDKGWEESYRMDGNHRAEKVFDWDGRSLEPWWDVYIEQKGGNQDFALFRISPSEKVFPSFRTDHTPYKEMGYCLSGKGRWVPLPAEASSTP